METADLFDFNLIFNFLTSVTFNLITFIACVYYVVRKQNPDGYLLSSGSFLHLLTSIFYSVVLPIMVRKSGVSIYSNKSIMLLGNVVAVIGSILFVTGLIMLIFNYLSLSKKVENQNLY